MFEMEIDSIRVSLMNYQRVVILKEKASDRYLPIWIGPAEADAIAVKLQEVSVPRPLTHDLLNSVIGNLGANISRIVVTDLSNDTFYAKIVLQSDGKWIEIDSRPSDAIALAVRTETPIFAEEAVMDKASIVLDKETGKPLLPDIQNLTRTDEQKPVEEEELKRMSAFQDFVQGLDLEGLGKSGGTDS